MICLLVRPYDTYQDRTFRRPQQEQPRFTCCALKCTLEGGNYFKYGDTNMYIYRGNQRAIT
jgi:hypothetical protein